MSRRENFHVVLKSRPGVDGEPSEDNFAFEPTPYPEDVPDGNLVIKNLYISVDPVLRCRMNQDSGADYVKAWDLNTTLTGFGGVGEVIETSDPAFIVGDFVTSLIEWPWKQFFVREASNVTKAPKEISSLSPSLMLSAFGGTGVTAYLGIKEKGHVTKGANQTVVVSGAAGSTGSLAGQIAKTMGCGLLVGICGSDSKGRWLTEELGFDAAINYKTESISERLKVLCPKGVDIYFDNVGADVSEQVIAQMNRDSHVVLCGQIASYNKDVPYPPPLSEKTSVILKEKNITRERFLVLNYQDQLESTVLQLMDLYAAGKLKVKETVEKGLANAGKAFVSMMTGKNLGKQLIQVSDATGS